MSIVEVANLAGMSHATVSRVINNRPGVSAESAQRVREAMKRLNYTPPAKRRGPVPRERQAVRTGNIAMLMLSTESTPLLAPMAASAIHAAEAALADHGFNMSLAHITAEGRLPPAVLNNGVDGLLLHGFPPGPEVAAKLSGYPSVWMLSRRTAHGDWGDRVTPDNEAAGRLAAEHLIDQGHRRLAFLRIESSHLGFRQREEAFVAAARARGVSVEVLAADPTISVDPRASEVDFAVIDSAVEGLVGLADRPTGVFVPRGRLTLMVYESLRRHGVEPGRDAQVLACDNDPILMGLRPRPVMIDIRSEVVGREAVELLLWRINQKGRDDATSQTTTRIEPRVLVPERSTDLEDAGGGRPDPEA